MTHAEVERLVARIQRVRIGQISTVWNSRRMTSAEPGYSVESIQLRKKLVAVVQREDLDSVTDRNDSSSELLLSCGSAVC